MQGGLSTTSTVSGDATDLDRAPTHAHRAHDPSAAGVIINMNLRREAGLPRRLLHRLANLSHDAAISVIDNSLTAQSRWIELNVKASGRTAIERDARTLIRRMAQGLRPNRSPGITPVRRPGRRPAKPLSETRAYIEGFLLARDVVARSRELVSQQRLGRQAPVRPALLAIVKASGARTVAHRIVGGFPARADRGRCDHCQGARRDIDGHRRAGLARAIEKCLIHVTPRERSCGERRDAKPVVREAEQKALSQHARAPTLCGEDCRR
jgi:hypothetical protein